MRKKKKGGDDKNDFHDKKRAKCYATSLWGGLETHTKTQLDARN